ncbi:MAG: GNAT family N-acetyltransferase [Anaerolineales bacterium]|nr:GNAT family N-acetyltransferase [Anaerolineales bacterium]
MQPMINTIELIRGDAIFTAVSPTEWNALAEESMTQTPFQRHAYQQAWWRHLGQGELFTVVVRRENGSAQDRLRGLAAFFVQDGTVFFNGSKEETDYLDIICRAEEAEMVWTAVLDCLCSDACPAWSALQLHCVPAASPTRELLPRLADSRGFVFSEVRDEVCPVIVLEGDFEDYLAGINKKQRHEIRRKMRRAHEVVFEEIGSDDDVNTAVEEFLRLLQASAQEKEQWLNDDRRALFHDLIPAMLQDGLLQLLFANLRGQRYAALLNFVYNDRTWVYNSGLDMSQHSNLSLGVVLSAHAIELATQRGYHTFDFLRGDETYKYRFGAEDTEIFCLKLVAPSA